MKSLIFRSDFAFQFARGADPVTAAGIAGSLGIVNSGLTASSSRAISNKQMQWQSQENAINRAYQTAEAEKARQWSEGMQTQMNLFNSPVNQARMFREAGLNPQVAMSNAGTVSAVSPPSSPMPAQVSGISPVSQQPLDLQIPQLFTGMSSLLSGIAEAKKAGIETDYLEKSMDLNLRNLSVDADLKEITSVGLKLDNYLKDKKMPADIQRAYDQAKEAAYDAIVSQVTIGKIKNETELLASQKRLNDVLSSMHGAQYDLLRLDLATYFKRLNSQLALQSAQTSSASASANLSTAQASAQKFINDMRSHFSAQEYETYVTQLMKDGMLSEADHAEAMRRLRIIEKTHGSALSSALDDALEWLKAKISIFGHKY